MTRFIGWVVVIIVVVMGALLIANTLNRPASIDLEEAVERINDGRVGVVRLKTVGGNSVLELDYVDGTGRSSTEVSNVDSSTVVQLLLDAGADNAALQTIAVETENRSVIEDWFVRNESILLFGFALIVVSVIVTGAFNYYQTITDSVLDDEH